MNIPEKSLLKPLEIAVFALKMTFFGMKTGHYGPHLLLILDFFNGIGGKFIKFSESF